MLGLGTGLPLLVGNTEVSPSGTHSSLSRRSPSITWVGSRGQGTTPYPASPALCPWALGADTHPRGRSHSAMPEEPMETQACPLQPWRLWTQRDSEKAGVGVAARTTRGGSVQGEGRARPRPPGTASWSVQGLGELLVSGCQAAAVAASKRQQRPKETAVGVSSALPCPLHPLQA